MQTCWETHSAYEKMCILVATATLPPSPFTKRQQKRQICVRDSFALCRDCIKGPNLATHADMIGVNVPALLYPIAFNMTKVIPISYHSLPWYNIIPRHPHSSCSFILLSQGEEGMNTKLLH